MTEGISKSDDARPLPAVPRGAWAESEARVVAFGYDTYQEALDLRLSSRLVDQLDKTQADAKALDNDHGGQSVTTMIGGETVQVRPAGMKGGVKYVFGNDDFMVMIRSPKADWCVSVRYLAAGLWEYGIGALRQRAHKALFAAGALGKTPRYAVASRADYAFDIHAPRFSLEMVPGITRAVLCPAATKQEVFEVHTIGKRGRIETLNIGARGAGLQVAVYDKTREIREASAKTWMQELWAASADGELLSDDVWRIECRFGSDFLKDRNVRTFDDVDALLPSLLVEALYTRRLTVPTADTNPARWPLHPMWSLAVEIAGGVKMLPRGRYVVGKRDDLADQLEGALAGLLRSRLVLKPTDADHLLATVRERMTSDPDGQRKEDKARERYRFVDEAG